MYASESKLEGAGIIFVFGGLELGGAERQGFLLARHLKETCGSRVQVWALDSAPGRLSALCDEARIPWRGFSFPLSKPTALPRLLKLAAALRKERPGILLPYTYFPNILCGLVWKYTGAKLCVWNQRDEVLNLSRVCWQKAAVRRTPYFLANSSNAKKTFVSLYHLGEDRVTVIHNGISLNAPVSDRNTWRRRLGLPEETFTACMLANIHPDKDHMTLLRAWETVFLSARQEGRPDPVLVLAGRSGEYGEKLKTTAADMNLGNSVRFIGPVDDVAGLLHAVDLCVHSSKSEGLPNAVLEAMSAGLPVAGTDIPGIREAVGIEGISFLSPTEDFHQLAAIIIRFLHDPLFRKQVGSTMQKRVQEEFDLTAMCTKSASFLAGAYQA